jgi:Mrp family chromosome partitioning ATPase/uncharacterized protein involved in exopolysaccharide biosynthesis
MSNDYSNEVPALLESQPDDHAPGRSRTQDAQWQLIRSVLRGRYGWVALLSLVLGGGGAVAGWLIGKPVYRSGVAIKVSPVLSRVLYKDEAQGALPQYERFVETQISMIKNQDVLSAAVSKLAENPTWRQAHISTDPRAGDTAILELARNVSAIRSNELMLIYVSDRDPQCAMLGAQALVDAYLRLRVTPMQVDPRLVPLQAEENKYRQSIEGKKQEIRVATAAFNGVEDLTMLFDEKFAEVRKYQMEKVELQPDLITAAVGEAEQRVMSAEDLAGLDAVLADLLKQRNAGESKLIYLTSQGFGSQHRETLAAQAEQDRVQKLIQERVTYLRQHPPVVPRADGAAAGSDPKLIQAKLKQFDKLIEDASKEMVALYAASIEVSGLKADLDGLNRKLDLVHQRMDELTLEPSVSDRISVLGPADRPLEPFSDPRRKYAAMMGMAGVCAGFALVLMLGLIDRRLRHVDEVKVRLSLDHVLGMLPTLPQDLADPEAAALAAHAVHHIRAMLQIRAGAKDSPVFAVTSPVAGAGKTSLTLGLGLSFASSGSRTLLIDMDIIGGGLTSRTQSIIRKKLGRILIDRGLLSEAQLRKALELPPEPGVRLGQRLVELGYATASAVDASLHIQASPSLGVLELLQGAPLERCVRETEIPGLWMMPLGGALPQHAASLSPATVSHMLRAARKRFDTILIDTGPTPGSLEASVVAAQADGVVVVVSRGHSSREVERCLHQLKAVAAPIAGVVFNRATGRDLLIGQTATRFSSRKGVSGVAPLTVADPIEHRGDFGPVASAVASTGAHSPLGSRPFDVPAEGNRKGDES